ncbi:MAG: response regulator [Acidobacteria bacterium]|nr:response regulator [Acidobacteriota bacterium]
MEPIPVLIVDDEADFRSLLVEALEGEGYAAAGAESAEVALERVKARHYPVIFTDLNMPGGLSGLELIKIIHELDPRTFSILMTGYATTESAIQALKRGAYDFIQKPFKLAELEASLERALAHYRTLRENEAYQTRLEEMVEQRTKEILHLKDNIENLFEGFVQASIVAIEARDPSTSGHSTRVATMTVGLAEAVNRTPHGPYGDTTFTERQIREIRYASLLHDFGKVGVREQVLVKAQKLDPQRLEQILQRLHQRDLELSLALLERAWQDGVAFEPGRLEKVLEDRRSETRELVEIILRSNQPHVLPREVRDALDRLEGLEFRHWDGKPRPVLESVDIEALRIPKGSLSKEERDEINSHVTHTFRFLSQIPWTEELAQVPLIAYAHHERLNGQGYPRQLRQPAIPVQSRLMAVADVFDALAAKDRPYKKAVSVERSLGILEDETRVGLLDQEIFRIFVEAKIYEMTLSQHNSLGAAP